MNDSGPWHEAILAWSTVVLAIAGILLPPRLDRSGSKRLSCLPIAAVGCYLAYELTNDPTYNIRVDLLLLWPLLGLSVLAMLIRLAVIHARETTASQPSDNENG